MKKLFIISVFIVLLSPALTLAENETISTERQQLQEKMQEYKDAKAEVRDAAKAQVLSRTKTLALKSIDRIIAKYQHFLSVVSKMPSISDANKADFSSKVNSEIILMRAKKTEVTAATTVAEVKAVTETLKAQSRKSNDVVKLMVIALKKTHIENIVVRLNSLIVKLEVKVAEKKALGSDVTQYEALINTTKSDIAKAQDHLVTNAVSDAKTDIVSVKESLKSLVDLLGNNVNDEVK